VTRFHGKSTVDQIRARFDADVERFSNLDTGQVAAMDSPMHMALVAEAAAAVTPGAQRILDIGCGAGNYTLKLLQHFADRGAAAPAVDLIDLSKPMLDRAAQRIAAVNDQPILPMQGDVRELDLGEQRYDIVIAAQCLHHLRGEDEWLDVFSRVFRGLRPGGSFWIADQVLGDPRPVQAMMWRRWGEYLLSVKDEAYRDHAFAYVEAEDTPRPLAWQLLLMHRVGFEHCDVLHKHGKFASFGGVKGADDAL